MKRVHYSRALKILVLNAFVADAHSNGQKQGK